MSEPGSVLVMAETNVAIGLARQGFPVRWLGRVGADAGGAALLTRLRGEGVDVGCLGGWLRDQPPDQALLAGMVAAAVVVGAVTDTEGLPDADERAGGIAALGTAPREQVRR